MPEMSPGTASGEGSAGAVSVPSQTPIDWEGTARSWEERCQQAWDEREGYLNQLNELRRSHAAANNLMNAAEQRAHAAEQRLRVAREQGWRVEWNGRDRVIVAEVLVERANPVEPWPVVTIDGYRLPWLFRSICVGEITDDLATVTLVLEAGLVVQSNEMPLQDSDEQVRERAESLIERTHRAAAIPVTAPADIAETEGK